MKDYNKFSWTEISNYVFFWLGFFFFLSVIGSIIGGYDRIHFVSSAFLEDKSEPMAFLLQSIAIILFLLVIFFINRLPFRKNMTYKKSLAISYLGTLIACFVMLAFTKSLGNGIKAIIGQVIYFTIIYGFSIFYYKKQIDSELREVNEIIKKTGN